jgi:hypothetical protein
MVAPALPRAVEPVPTALVLTEDAEPLELSRDGRTLYFLRQGWLWRLDLRAGLPRLLSELAVPGLPLPAELAPAGGSRLSPP